MPGIGGAQDRGLECEADSDVALLRPAWLYVIGINDYESNPQIPDLETAVHDARSIRDILVARYQFSPERLIERYDGEATRTQIHADLRSLAERLDERDSLLIYYAGHGYEDKLLAQGYWIPVDGEPIPNTASWISNSDVHTYLKGIKARHIWLISDSCFSGTLLGQRAIVESPGEGDEYFRKVHRDKSRQVLTSGGDEPVADGGYDGHSVFASHLLHFLETQDATYLTAAQAADRVRMVVGNDAQQTPRFAPLREVGDQMGEFVLVARQGTSRSGDEITVEVQTGPVGDLHGEIAYLERVRQLRDQYESDLIDEAEADWEAITPLLSSPGPEARMAADLYLRKYAEASIRVDEEAFPVAVPHVDEARRASSDAASAPVVQSAIAFARPSEDLTPSGATAAASQGDGPGLAGRPTGRDIAAEAARLLEQRRRREEQERELRDAVDEAKVWLEEDWTNAAATAAAGGPEGERALLSFLSEHGRAVTVKVGEQEALVAVARNEDAAARFQTFDLVTGFAYPMTRVDRGQFWMGSPPDEPGRGSDERRHLVTLSQPFAIGITEVSQELYKAVMETNPSGFKDDDNPVERVTWYDALDFCNRLSTLEGYEPVYSRSGDRGQQVHWDASANGYRLPTEAEWEYAARAGSDTLYAGSNDPADVAQISRPSPADIGQKLPNAWGLLDMSGNVREWVWDGYENYPGSQVLNPTGPESAPERVFRGGSYEAPADVARVANRSHHQPDARSKNVGFRVARTLAL